MFKERKEESAEAAMLKILEEDKDFAVSGNLGNMKGMTSVQHHETEQVHRDLGNRHHRNAEDLNTEARIAARRGDHKTYLEKLHAAFKHRKAGNEHLHMAEIHNVHGHLKAGRKIEDIII